MSTILADAITYITAGETLSATLTRADYPPSTHSLEYRFRHAGGTFTATCTESGSNYILTVAASVTEDITPGDVLFVGYATVTATSAVVKIDSGSIKVYANPVKETTNARALRAIRARIEGRATDDQLTLSLGDVTLGYMKMDELIKAESLFARRVAGEMEKAVVAAGGPSRRRILTRFGSA